MRREPEACTPALHCRYNLVDVVTYNAKPDILGVLFDHATQSCLSCGSHHVRFVKDDEFKARRIEGPGLRKVFDLLADDINSAIVRCVQLRKPVRNSTNSLV